MKQCFKCEASKPLSEFYRHSQMADGHLNKCKECAKRDAVVTRYRRILNDPQWVEKERVRAREKTRRTWRSWPKPDPVKRKARIAVGNAVRDGKLIRKPCQVCGAKAHAHHTDYSKPLEVVWLCSAHHGEQHRKVA
jgi:hypothetical protein